MIKQTKIFFVTQHRIGLARSRIPIGKNRNVFTLSKLYQLWMQPRFKNFFCGSFSIKQMIWSENNEKYLLFMIRLGFQMETLLFNRRKMSNTYRTWYFCHREWWWFCHRWCILAHLPLAERAELYSKICFFHSPFCFVVFVSLLFFLFLFLFQSLSLSLSLEFNDQLWICQKNKKKLSVIDLIVKQNVNLHLKWIWTYIFFAKTPTHQRNFIPKKCM